MEWDTNIAAQIDSISDGERPPAHLLAPAIAQLNAKQQAKKRFRRKVVLSVASAAAALFLCIFTPIAVYRTSHTDKMGAAPESLQPNTEFSYSMDSLTAAAVPYAALPNAETARLFPAFTHVFGDETEYGYTLYTIADSEQPAFAEMRTRRVSLYGYEDIFVYTVYTERDTDIFDAYQVLQNTVWREQVYEDGEYMLRLTFLHGERQYYMTVMSANAFATDYYEAIINIFQN